MAQEQSKHQQGEEEDYSTPFGPDDAVLVKNLNFSYGDRQVRGGNVGGWGGGPFVHAACIASSIYRFIPYTHIRC